MYKSLLLLLAAAIPSYSQQLSQQPPKPAPTPDAYVRANEIFSVSHSRRTVKARLLGCDALDPRDQQPPKVVEYERWRNIANTTEWHLPKEAVGCYYDIGKTIVKVTP